MYRWKVPQPVKINKKGWGGFKRSAKPTGGVVYDYPGEVQGLASPENYGNSGGRNPKCI